jgi:LEA14-like dessication related protein
MKAGSWTTRPSRQAACGALAITTLQRLNMQWLPPALAIAGVAVLASCADAPRVTAPRIAVETVRLERITGTEATFEVVLSLSNPNAREIAVDSVDANLTIGDVPVGSATLVSPLRLRANGETTAAVQARAGIAAVLRVVAEISQRAREQRGTGQPVRLRYAVSGTAMLEGGWTIPFSRNAEFLVNAPATTSR